MRKPSGKEAPIFAQGDRKETFARRGSKRLLGTFWGGQKGRSEELWNQKSPP